MLKCCTSADVWCSHTVVTRLCVKQSKKYCTNIQTKENFWPFQFIFFDFNKYLCRQKNIYYKVVRPQSKMLNSFVTSHEVTMFCTESVLKIMDAGYCLYVHIFVKNIISLKPINFYNSNQFVNIVVQRFHYKKKQSDGETRMSQTINRHLTHCTGVQPLSSSPQFLTILAPIKIWFWSAIRNVRYSESPLFHLTLTLILSHQ